MPTNNKPDIISDSDFWDQYEEPKEAVNPTEGLDELLANVNPMNSSGDQDDYPEWKPFNINDDPKPLAPELIEGILRKGHKMLISGASKAGKSFLLIQLAFSLSEGKPWLGYFNCAKCKVLYVNFEVDEGDFDKRLRDICQNEHTNITGTNENFISWTLRGKDTSYGHFVPILIKRLKDADIGAVIIDPLYKLDLENECDNSVVAKFFREIDKICTERDVSVIMCHHHSKGDQGNKSSIDRSSGAGVFARDPDALLDMIQIDPNTATEKTYLEPSETVWRISFTLRNFRSPDDMEIIYSHPIHRVALEFQDAEPFSGHYSKSKRGIIKKIKQRNKNYDRLVLEVKKWNEQNKKYPTVKEIATYLDGIKGFSETNIRNLISGKNSSGEDLEDFEPQLIKKNDGRIYPIDTAHNTD